MKKSALYYRVSSDDQKERDTIENQIDTLHTYIELKEEFEIYDEYPDNGVSGTIPFEQRTEGNRLLKDAEKGLFDTVLVWKVDRFGRDTLSGLQAVEMLRKYNIEIISITEPFDLNTPTGRFQFITYLNMAELDRNNILDRMFLGATRAAKNGKWMGGIVPYGYFVNNDGFLEIDKDESEVIKKIFDLYTNDKLSLIDIAVYLNNAGIQSSCGSGKGGRTKGITKMWRAGSIQRIISSTTYKGIHKYGKRASRRKEPILREVPAIVTEETWDLAQEIKKENLLDAKRCNNKRDYLLRGLIKCKYCGKTYYGISYKDRSSVYCCSGKRGENKRILGIKCDNININTEMIENEVWKDCLNILLHYDEYINDIKRTSKSGEQDYISELNNLKCSFTDLNREKNSILTLFRKNKILEEELDEQLADIRKDEEKLQKLILITEGKIGMKTQENELIEGMSSKLKYYHDKIDNLTFEDKRDIVKLLVKQITVETVIQNGARIPKIDATYNLVKLAILTDAHVGIMDINLKNASVLVYK